MPVTLESALKKCNSQTIEKLGKRESLFKGRIYLAFNKKEGWHVQQLNFFKVLARHLFKSYADTHLRTVAFQLHKEHAEKLNLPLVKRIYTSWNREHSSEKIKIVPEPVIESKTDWKQQLLTHLKELQSKTKDQDKVKVDAIFAVVSQKEFSSDLIQRFRQLHYIFPSSYFTDQLNSFCTEFGVDFAKIDAADPKKIAAELAKKQLAQICDHLNALLTSVPQGREQLKVIKMHAFLVVLRDNNIPLEYSSATIDQILNLKPGALQDLNAIGKELRLHFDVIDADEEKENLNKALEALFKQVNRPNMDKIFAIMVWVKSKLSLDISADLNSRLKALDTTLPTFAQQLDAFGIELGLDFAKIEAEHEKRELDDNLRQLLTKYFPFLSPAVTKIREAIEKLPLDRLTPELKGDIRSLKNDSELLFAQQLKALGTKLGLNFAFTEAFHELNDLKNYMKAQDEKLADKDPLKHEIRYIQLTLQEIHVASEELKTLLRALDVTQDRKLVMSHIIKIYRELLKAGSSLSDTFTKKIHLHEIVNIINAKIAAAPDDAIKAKWVAFKTALLKKFVDCNQSMPTQLAKALQDLDHTTTNFADKLDKIAQKLKL